MGARPEGERGRGVPRTGAGGGLRLCGGGGGLVSQDGGLRACVDHVILISERDEGLVLVPLKMVCCYMKPGDCENSSTGLCCCGARCTFYFFLLWRFATHG